MIMLPHEIHCKYLCLIRLLIDVTYALNVTSHQTTFIVIVIGMKQAAELTDVQYSTYTHLYSL